MKKAPSTTVEYTSEYDAAAVLAELRAAAALADDTIVLDDPDNPEVFDWSGAERGRFYRPRKVQKTLRIDADVVAFYESQGSGYLSRMNRDLRAVMLQAHRRRQRVRLKPKFRVAHSAVAERR